MTTLGSQASKSINCFTREYQLMANQENISWWQIKRISVFLNIWNYHERFTTIPLQCFLKICHDEYTVFLDNMEFLAVWRLLSFFSSCTSTLTFDHILTYLKFRFRLLRFLLLLPAYMRFELKSIKRQLLKFKDC